MAAKKFDADWVINNDADEFWVSRTGTVRTALEAMPREAECLAVRRFDMVPSRDPQARFFETMVMRLPGGQTVHGYRSPPKACHRAFPDVTVADGNHHVNRNGSRMPERSDHGLEIVHYPLRSLAQIERKVRQGAAALEANPRLPPSTNSHWRRLHRDYFVHGRLGDYYDEHAPTAEQIAADVAAGTLAEDTRIRDALRRIDPMVAAAD
jgi:hypothetical protein